jgi:predicted Zn-dependent peptidase
MARLLAAAAVTAALAAPALSQVKDYRKIKFPEMRKMTIPEPQRIVLDNGMVVMLLENHELPLIEVMARVHTGSRLEPAGKIGMAAMFGQVLRTGGTKTRTGDQIDEYLEARAAMIDTNVGVDSGSANLSCLKQDFDNVLPVFADVLRNPAFAEDKIKLSKTQATSFISRRNDNPQGVMNREFAKLVYGETSPYARTPEYATIDAVTRDDFMAFHAKYYVPNRVILGVVGDFDSKEMAGKLKAAFGDWAKGPAEKDEEATWQGSPRPGYYYVQKEDMTQSDIIIGHMGIRRDNPDYYAVEVMNEVLGGGFAARLFSNVRSKKGLAYSVRGGLDSNFDYPGTFNTWMTTKNETTAAGIDALMAEIDGINSNPVTDVEVKEAKESILNSFVFNYDSPAKILRQQITYEYFGYPADYLVRYRENIEKITKADVARVAAKYIHKDQLAVLVVGPSKGTDRPLESFGKVTKLDIAIKDSKSAGTAVAASPESLSKGKAIFEKVVQALGGGDAVDSVKSIRTVSSSTMKSPMGDVSVKVVSTLSLPDRLRQEATTPMGPMISVINGDDGYLSMASRGTRPLPEARRADLAKSIRRQAISLAQHRNDKDFKVQSLGSETVDGAALEALLVSFGGEETKLHVDADGHIVRQSYRGAGPSGPADMVSSYSDFRPAANVVLPYKSQTTMNGEMQQSSVAEEIAVNPSVDEALFKKPEDASAPDGAANRTGN